MQRYTILPYTRLRSAPHSLSQTIKVLGPALAGQEDWSLAKPEPVFPGGSKPGELFLEMSFSLVGMFGCRSIRFQE